MYFAVGHVECSPVIGFLQFTNIRFARLLGVIQIYQLRKKMGYNLVFLGHATCYTDFLNYLPQSDSFLFGQDCLRNSPKYWFNC